MELIRFEFALVALLLLSAMPTLALAQDDPHDAEARALFDAANVAYADGRFADAEGYFRRSYELSERPELLYNLALAADQARHDQAALEAYEAFVEALPNTERAPRARNRIEALSAMLDDGEPVAVPDTGDASSSTTPSGDGNSGGGGGTVAGIVLLAAGGAVAIAGGVLVGLAAADVDSVENAERGTAWADVSDAHGRSEAFSTAGFVLLGVGVAAAVAGVVVMAVGSDDSGESARVRVGPGSLALEGTFR